MIMLTLCVSWVWCVCTCSCRHVGKWLFKQKPEVSSTCSTSFVFEGSSFTLNSWTRWPENSKDLLSSPDTVAEYQFRSWLLKRSQLTNRGIFHTSLLSSILFSSFTKQVVTTPDLTTSSVGKKNRNVLNIIIYYHRH